MAEIRDIQFIPQPVAVKQTLAEIDELRKGKVVTLKTRWKGLNKLMLGGFRPGQNVVIAGLSGHAKSWFLTFLKDDLLNKELNPDFPKPIVLIHFAFEMTPNDETLRLISSKTGISYEKLISSESPLTDEEYAKVVDASEKIKQGNVFISKRPGNRYEILKAINGAKDSYPDHQIIFTIDHSLLVSMYDEKSETELLAALSKTLIQLKQNYNTIGIVIGQLLQEITTPYRTKDRKTHFPLMNDIHGSKQMVHATDWMFVINDPSMYLNESHYGTFHIYKDRLFLHLLKGRFVSHRNILVFKKALDLGTLIEVDPKKEDVAQTEERPLYGEGFSHLI